MSPSDVATIRKIRGFNYRTGDAREAQGETLAECRDPSGASHDAHALIVQLGASLQRTTFETRRLILLKHGSTHSGNGKQTTRYQ